MNESSAPSGNSCGCVACHYRTLLSAAKAHLEAWDQLKKEMGDTDPDGPKTALLRKLVSP